MIALARGSGASSISTMTGAASYDLRRSSAERKVRHSPWHHLRATSGRSAQEEAQHFIRCPACGGWIDCRDLVQVFEHEGPLPHATQDQPQ